MDAEDTVLLAQFMKMHELADALSLNISHLRADVLDEKNTQAITSKFRQLDELIATLQEELQKTQQEYRNVMRPEKVDSRWKVAPTF